MPATFRHSLDQSEKVRLAFFMGSFLRSHLFLGMAGSFFGFSVSAPAAVPAYSFMDFEAAAGWSVEPLPAEKAGLHLIQGEAAVVGLPEESSRQVLQMGPSMPFAAVFVETRSVSKAPVVFCEFLAQPPAVDEQTDAEFIDFGGAILGFFHVAGRGEVRALFNRTAEESVWISTGASFDLDASGLAADWLQIAIRLDRRSERWNLTINGVAVLSGMRSAVGSAAGLALWLYGQQSQPCRFDDLLITSVEPDHLEKMLAWQSLRASRVREAGNGHILPKLVTKASPVAELRSALPALRSATSTLVEPVLRDWKATLKIGQTTYNEGAEVDFGGSKGRLLVYSPGYDETGSVLAGSLTMTADAELRPGTDISRIRWMMGEMKSLSKLGTVFAAGDFSTGLVQTVTIPTEWIRKATMSVVWVHPGNSDVLWWDFKIGHDASLQSR